jgi:hypothetical protein
MTTFTIDHESNKIIPVDSEHDGEVAAGTERFSSHADLASLAVNWPMARLIEIWNNLPGVKPVNRFKDRKTAITRIWSALNDPDVSAPLPAESAIEVIPASGTEEHSEVTEEPEQQPMFAPEAAQGPNVAPAPTAPPKKATRNKKAHTAPRTANGSPKATKTETILALMKQPGGTTLNAIMNATGWQAHSVRGFISGTLGKKMGLTVLSTKNENGGRTYRIQ